MPLPEEILGRLQVNGATVAGGSSQYAGFIPMLDASGQLHSSLFSNVVIAGVHRVTDQSARLSLTDLKPGDIVVQISPAQAYALRELPSNDNDNWELIGITNVAEAANITVNNNYTDSTLSASDLQAVI
ncbi:MAG: hypothetical protein EBU46_00005, partial [Nitrosomonadaceae bacterium]|nr:hypothetical protein [Nitrosomonadaceae bacterium]